MNESNSNEIDFNKKNREESEELVEKSSVKKDGYWDKNSPAVKVILAFMGLFILGGVAYYIVTYLLNK